MSPVASRSAYESIRGTCVDLHQLLQLRHYAHLLRDFVSQPATGDLAGARVTRLRGRGVDFAEVRAWQPGDDMRSIDWRVTARKGKPHTRIFREERERPSMLLVDQGPSLYFGSRRRLKSVAVAEISVLLAWAVLENGDRIGALVRVPDGAPEVFRPARSRQRLLRIIDTIARTNARLPATGALPLNETVRELRRVQRPGGQVFMVSDFQDVDTATFDELTHLARHSELVLVVVHDPLEEELPPPATYRISDANQRTQIDTGDRDTRKAFRERYRARLADLEKFALQNRSICVTVATNDNPLEALARRREASQ